MQSRLCVRLVWLHPHHKPMRSLQLVSDVEADLAQDLIDGQASSACRTTRKGDTYRGRVTDNSCSQTPQTLAEISTGYSHLY